MAYLPASVLLGRMSVPSGLAHTAWIVLFGLALFRLWRASFRRYESASS
jgi:ABC-type uncharacterized transport system permease subunit